MDNLSVESFGEKKEFHSFFQTMILSISFIEIYEVYGSDQVLHIHTYRLFQKIVFK